MTLVVGDCRATLARWAVEGVRVQTVVTSPPYWGLRDYGTAPLVWALPYGECGGHYWGDEGRMVRHGAQGNKTTLTGGDITDGDNRMLTMNTGATCSRCGAWRGSLGMEPTPERYVAHLVAVLRLVRDVLADDGTLWLNLGDSYATGAGKVGERPGGGAQGDNWKGAVTSPNRMPIPGLKPKDLVGIPWRVAFALQADGWYLRADIIWSKPNPMPESVTDRPTKAHEYLFLLSKRERYYYDADAIREPNQPQSIERASYPGRTHPRVWHTAGMPITGGDQAELAPLNPAGRNRRSVWTIATAPYPEAHFATFPPDLVTPCILAGSRPGDTVLDPFMGAGTVAMVAQDLGRAWLGCELSAEYAALCERRTRQQGLVLTTAHVLTPDG